MAVEVKDLVDWLKTLSSDAMVAVDQDGLSLVEVDSDAYYEVGGLPSRFLNHYHCTHAGRLEEGQPAEEWDDESECMNNDKCPVCNAEIEPYESEDIE